MGRVLVADDEPKLGRMVVEMLELDGHTVVRAEDGAEALARLAAERFDVIVTDCACLVWTALPSCERRGRSPLHPRSCS